MTISLTSRAALELLAASAGALLRGQGRSGIDGLGLGNSALRRAGDGDHHDIYSEKRLYSDMNKRPVPDCGSGTLIVHFWVTGASTRRRSIMSDPSRPRR